MSRFTPTLGGEPVDQLVIRVWSRSHCQGLPGGSWSTFWSSLGVMTDSWISGIQITDYRLQLHSNFVRRGLEQPGQDRGFWVFPLVYCVAYNETYQTMFYRDTQQGYQRVQATPELHSQVFGREAMFYYRATGSCKGNERC